MDGDHGGDGADDEEGLEVAERRPLGEAFEAGHGRGARAGGGRGAGGSISASSSTRARVGTFGRRWPTRPCRRWRRCYCSRSSPRSPAPRASIHDTVSSASKNSAPHAARARLLRGVFRRRGRRLAPHHRNTGDAAHVLGGVDGDRPDQLERVRPVVHVAGQPARRGRPPEDHGRARLGGGLALRRRPALVVEPALLPGRLPRGAPPAARRAGRLRLVARRVDARQPRARPVSVGHERRLLADFVRRVRVADAGHNVRRRRGAARDGVRGAGAVDRLPRLPGARRARDGPARADDVPDGRRRGPRRAAAAERELPLPGDAGGAAAAAGVPAVAQRRAGARPVVPRPLLPQPLVGGRLRDGAVDLVLRLLQPGHNRRQGGVHARGRRADEPIRRLAHGGDAPPPRRRVLRAALEPLRRQQARVPRAVERHLLPRRAADDVDQLLGLWPVRLDAAAHAADRADVHHARAQVLAVGPRARRRLPVRV